MAFSSGVRFLMAFTVALWTIAAGAAPPPNPTDVCVRNFHPQGAGINPCGRDPSHFVEVVNAGEIGGTTCTKIYAESYCDSSPKSFKHVEAANHEWICTVEFHQEGVAEYCYSNPKIFTWARGQ